MTRLKRPKRYSARRSHPPIRSSLDGYAGREVMMPERLGTWALAAAVLAGRRRSPGGSRCAPGWSSIPHRSRACRDRRDLAERRPAARVGGRSRSCAPTSTSSVPTSPLAEADPIWVYIGYYGTERGGRPEHVPRGCFTGAGWDIASARVIGAEDGYGPAHQRIPRRAGGRAPARPLLVPLRAEHGHDRRASTSGSTRSWAGSRRVARTAR